MQYDYWGKTFLDGDWHHLGHHCLDVAAVAERLLDTNPVWSARMVDLAPMPSVHARSLLLFLAACHDLGKFHPGFQRLTPLGEKFGHRRGGYAHHHTEYGLAFWEKLWPWDYLDLPDEYSLKPLLTAAFCHHGSPRGICDLGHSTFSVEADAEAFVREMAARFLCESYEQFREAELEPLSWFAAGLIILADWIGSNEHWFKPVSRWDGFEAYWPAAQGRAADAVAALGLAGARATDTCGFADLLPHLKGCAPSHMQQAVLDLPEPAGPEMLIIEDLTGGGKTEAALLAAHRSMRFGLASGLYVGLPTMATANAMYERLARGYRALFDQDIFFALAHGGTFLNETYMSGLGARQGADNDEGAAVSAHWLADSRKKALLAACGVGTIDQALLGVLGAKHQSLRLLGLCRSVLVVDEVHSYDVYTGELLANLLRFHAAMGGSAVLLSATMTDELRRSLAGAWRNGRTLAGKSVPEFEQDADPFSVPFPLMTRLTDEKSESMLVATRRALNVVVDSVHDESGMFDTLRRAFKAGACACWIRNTVADVLDAARLLVEEYGLPADRVLVFHSRFTGADRADIERDVLHLFGKESVASDRAGKILIASQVVEQSLDLDFDVLLSDLAPMELMIQRAGRCHRHERSRPVGYETAVMRVLMPEPGDDAPGDWYGAMFEKGQYVYPRPAVLWRTARLLCTKGAIVLPRDARELVEGAYGDGVLCAPQSMDGREMDAFGKECADKAVACFGSLDFSGGYSLEGSPWGDDVAAPTRLGEPGHGLRLLRVEDDGVRLWSDDGKGVTMDNCVRSEVRVAVRLLSSAHVPESCAGAVSSLMESMPDKGRWCVYLPLREISPGVWSGSGEDGRGVARNVRYDRRCGLVVD
ncbi:CRISPR-associated helicase Cas3' [Pseudodesulfovibrio senegalensis]|uniref:CRISPR-associated helicase Cas3' n=1 Tax=Pseudodesulfovibrio senegalensis TaxID=1721087 RepID=UPI001375A34F|nr:CRISPR-associated helicase Cas3' [Pseudodesulfovibrio senegalensis]